MIKIIIAEDQALVQHALIALLKQEDDFEIIATANDGNALLELLEISKPDIILLDIEYSSPNGLEVTKIIDAKTPWVKVISLSLNNHPFYIKEMLKYGAKGFLSKNCTAEELFEGIRTVYKEKTYFCSFCSNVLLRDFVRNPIDSGIDFRTITPREIEIISLLSEGCTTKEIAEKLFISDKTVERHKSNLLKKLKLRNTAHLVKIAVQNGLLFH
ncbi:MAG: response regulator transcription factor [Bacteroidetes bacterium]|nr:response regulator transcription factor [Bacteroidota bacterium]